MIPNLKLWQIRGKWRHNGSLSQTLWRALYVGKCIVLHELLSGIHGWFTIYGTPNHKSWKPSSKSITTQLNNHILVTRQQSANFLCSEPEPSEPIKGNFPMASSSMAAYTSNLQWDAIAYECRHLPINTHSYIQYAHSYPSLNGIVRCKSLDFFLGTLDVFKHTVGLRYFYI